MSKTYLLVALEYLLFSLHFKEYLCQYEVASSCNGNNLQITCLDNEKIAIQRIFFGARPADSRLDCEAEGETDPNCCRRGYGDCIDYNFNTAAIVTRLCTGRSSCLFLTRSVKLDRCPDPKQDDSDYMTVFYNCIPDSSTVNICSDDKIQAKPPLYLSNKEYPLPRTGISNCTCMIVKHPSQARLSLRAIEISFIDPECSVSLTVKLGEGPENKFPCGYKMISYRQWLNVTSDEATVSLINEQDQGDTYLWLQIESPDKSEDPVGLYCGLEKDCFGTCHDTFGKGFTLNLKSFINPLKVKKYCRKIDERLSCFESQLEQCSSTEKMDADKELKANLAGQEVICEENLNEVQYMEDCYNMKDVRRGLTSCDQLLHPFENIEKTDICNLEKEFVDCVAKAVDDCNDTQVSMFMYNVTNDLFDFLYNTEDCDTESYKSVKEAEVMVAEKPTPEPESDDGTDKTIQPPVVPEKKAGDDKRNAASRVRGFFYPFHIFLIAYLIVFLS